jgi:ParB/RepB/Spo0J family partition protein
MTVNSIANLLTKKTSVHVDTSGESKKVLDIPLDLIEFDSEQPRQDILEEEVNDIVRTLLPEGSKINQPITTWPKNSNGKYLIKFGEKRTRASIAAGKKTIPVIIDDRYNFNDTSHKAINYAEQYVENNARGGLTALDDCVALCKLKEMLGSLKDVVKLVGAKSQGTISDKIKVAEIKNNPKYKFLLDLYNDDDNFKFKDLTNIRKILDVFAKNPDHFDVIKERIITAVSSGALNRQWVEALSSIDFDVEDVSVVKTDVLKSTEPNAPKPIATTNHIDNTGYKVRSVKKAKIMGKVSLGRKKQKCQLLLDRIDDEEGYVWVLLDGTEEPVRASLSKITLTEFL